MSGKMSQDIFPRQLWYPSALTGMISGTHHSLVVPTSSLSVVVFLISLEGSQGSGHELLSPSVPPLCSHSDILLWRRFNENSYWSSLSCDNASIARAVWLRILLYSGNELTKHHFRLKLQRIAH